MKSFSVWQVMDLSRVKLNDKWLGLNAKFKPGKYLLGLLIVCIMASIEGCGQTGRLYLPDQRPTCNASHS